MTYCNQQLFRTPCSSGIDNEECPERINYFASHTIVSVQSQPNTVVCFQLPSIIPTLPKHAHITVWECDLFEPNAMYSVLPVQFIITDKSMVQMHSLYVLALIFELCVITTFELSFTWVVRMELEYKCNKL